jgi:hypothetical protein
VTEGSITVPISMGAKSLESLDNKPQRNEKTGRFLAGNSGNGGRRKGTKNKFTLSRQQLLEDYGAAWTKHQRRGILDGLAKETHPRTL